MRFAALEQLLEEVIGLEVTSVGSEVVTAAISRRLQARGLARQADYLQEVRRSPEELEALIDAVVVPETWFFRDATPFAALRQYATEAREGGPLRLLSAPCASGEEAYSIAMTLLEAGLPPDGFAIQAVDISRELLRRAEEGRYGGNSFRAGDLSYRERHFDPAGDAFVVRPGLRGPVRFKRANLVEARCLEGESPFHVIFCRNLLIYLTPAARGRLIGTLDRLLRPGGMLVVGHAEMLPCLGERFRPVPAPGAFAYRKGAPGPTGLPARVRPPRPAPHVRRAPRPPRAPAVPAPVVAPAPAAQPGGPSDLLARAARLADGGRLAEAAALCRESVRRDGTNAEAHYLLGVLLDACGRPEQAEASLNRAVYLDGLHYAAILHLSLLKARRGDGTGAEALRRRAAALGRRGGGET